MSKLPIEQPPVENPTALREWLTRMMTLVNGAISTMFDLDPISEMPDVTFDGMLRMFNTPVLPDIEYAGPWIYSSGSWRPLVADVSSVAANIAKIANRVSEANINNTAVVNPDKVNGVSFIEQLPIAEDVPLQITFGGAHGDSSYPVQILEDGTVLCNEAGDYDFDFVSNVSRRDTAQHAYLVLSSTLNGQYSGSSGVITIDHRDDNLPYSVSTTFAMEGGDEVRFFITRDQSGQDDGGLYPFTPSNTELPAVPSAWLKVTQRELKYD